MNKIIFTAFLLGFFFTASSQKKPVLEKDNANFSGPTNDSLRRGSSKSTSNKNIKNLDAKITDYLIISHVSDTTYVDTTLTIAKEYKYNYLRKDAFELMPFSNIGQTYNTLSYNFENTSLMPSFAARGRHFNYMEIEDINYYHVPTPLTELFHKSGFEQGQLIDAFFTVNTSKRFNMSIAYKGLRSLGNYQHLLTSTGNFRFTTSYKTKNNRYTANAHFVSQDLLNEENGGLTDESVLFFQSGEDDFKDRGVLEVNFENAQNILKGKRFYLNHSYALINKNDSISKNNLNLRHIVSLKDKSFLFEQDANNDFFGEAFQASIRDRVTLEELHNQFQINYSNNIIGDLQFSAGHYNYNYGYDKVVILDSQTITNRLKGDVITLGGAYKKQIGGFLLKGELGINASGDLDGNFIKAETAYQLNDDIKLSAQLNHNSKAPNYNALLNQSDYKGYNWQNNFNNVKTQQLTFNLKSNKLANISVDLTNINDYVYFAKSATDESVKPFQNEKPITYLRVKASKEIKYRNFALNNTVMYQNAQDENKVFNVSEIITRNTLYYSNHVFKKAMYLQTGITLNYFTQYKMNAYDPLLAEFYVQNNTEYGGFPRLDFFVNAKIRQTRIYIKAEHFNAAFSDFNYFSAPNNPYRDFKVRFGVVWNFFL